MTDRKIFVHIFYRNRFLGKKRRCGIYGMQDPFTIRDRKAIKFEKYRPPFFSQVKRRGFLSTNRMKTREGIIMVLTVDQYNACPILCKTKPIHTPKDS